MRIDTCYGSIINRAAMSDIAKSTPIVIPCGRRKVWDKQPNRAGVVARDVYIGTSFVLNRKYSERSGQKWLILSAKYGFVSPDFVIPGPYDVTFKDAATHPVSVINLQKQIVSQHLDQFQCVITLGSIAYRSVVESAFDPFGVRIVAPFACLPIGKYMQAVKRATAAQDHMDRQG